MCLLAVARAQQRTCVLALAVALTWLMLCSVAVKQERPHKCGWNDAS